jgi:acid phosphatase
MLKLYRHIQQANATLYGNLSFANKWDFFMKDPNTHLENLVSTGPFAGTKEAFDTGVKLRTRYERLLDIASAQNQTSFWASQSKRVIQTAEYFAAGFFCLSWNESAQLHVISESEDRGGDTLTAGKTCFKYLHNADSFGRNYGYRRWQEWRDQYLPSIVSRLATNNPDIRFTQDEVYSMQELCGFEFIAKGGSAWCDVFTREEQEAFEYARDLLHYYRTGPGNPYSEHIGWLWLNATANLLHEGPEAGPLFFSL